MFKKVDLIYRTKKSSAIFRLPSPFLKGSPVPAKGGGLNYSRPADQIKSNANSTEWAEQEEEKGPPSTLLPDL